MAEERLTSAVIPPLVLAGLLDLADTHGVVADAWFEGTGLTREQLFLPETKASYRQASTVIRRALAALPPGPTGLKLGSRDLLMSWGLLGVALRSCQTAADALAVLAELHQASGSMIDVGIAVEGDQVAITLTERAPDAEILPFLCEEGFAAGVMMMRASFGPDFAPARVEFGYPAPPYVATYRSFFRCPMEFGAGVNRMWLPVALLDARLPTYNPAQLAITLEATRRLVDPSEQRPDVVAAVEGLLRQDLRRPLTMQEVAERLFLSERSLRRKLASHGRSFAEVRDGVRRDRATLLLGETSRTVGSIATEVGFRDAREFRRAYVRWTGQRPSDVRRDGLDSDGSA